MAEQRRRLGDRDLERALADLGARLAYPPTPSLAADVRARLAQQPARRGPFWLPPRPLWRGVVLGVLALIIVAAATLGLLPAARTTVAEWLGLKGVEIRYAPASPTPPASPAGARPLLGERVSLDEARRRVTFGVRTPALAGFDVPDEVYAGESPPGGQVTLLYRARPGLPAADGSGTGLLLTQFRGETEPYIEKGIGPGTRLMRVMVDDVPGYWIEGAQHTLIYRDSTGRIRDEDSRLARNTLLWERNGITYRLESALDRGEALRIAESVR